jgi:hypothetical protein
VGVATPEAVVVALVPRYVTYVSDEPRNRGESVTAQMAIMVQAVHVAGQDLLEVSGSDVSPKEKIDTKPDGTFADGALLTGRPWIRLANVPFKVKTLEASSDPSGVVTIKVAGADGTQHTVIVDAGRNIISSDLLPDPGTTPAAH